MSATGRPHGPTWFHISTPDAARARHFYQEPFSWPVKLIDEACALAGDHGGQPAGGIGQAGPSSPYLGMVGYFPVDDAGSALVRAERLGGRRVLAPADTPISGIAVFTGPDGNRIGLVDR